MSSWSTPALGPNNEHFEVLRDYAHFGEDRAGERVIYKTVIFEHPVLNAEVFLSGFNIFYTREGHDHEVMQHRVDAWVDQIGVNTGPGIDPPYNSKAVSVKLMYSLTDEDTSDDDDYNDAYIGFTVLARTKE